MNSQHHQTVRAAVLGLALCSPLMAAAHTDIEVEIDPPANASGTLIVDPHDEITAATAIKAGRKIYEAEFGELGSPFGTDDPGFVVEDGNGIAGTILGFNVLDSLWKWDGSAWTNSGFDELFTITDVLSSEIVVADGVGAGLSGLIDQFDAGGGIHTHFDFEIGSTSGSPMDGAYFIELSLMGVSGDLSTPVYNNSDPFLIVFHLNEGGTFGEEAFEAAVGALTPVPVPAAAWLFGSAILAAGGLGRRTRRAA